MPLDYESPQASRIDEGNAWVLIVKLALIYLLISIVTLPFLDSIWLGEIPVLAIPQVPKTAFANWANNHLVLPVIKALGMSVSASPDWTVARPYGLAIAYLVPLVLLIGAIALRTKTPRRHVRWIVTLLLMAILDYCMMMWFAGGPGLSIY